jgi:hypothetical protein
LTEFGQKTIISLAKLGEVSASRQAARLAALLSTPW